jgi:hypothetical protein
LEIHENILETTIENIEYYRKLIHSNAPKDITSFSYDGLPSGNGNHMSLDRILDSLHRFESMKYLEECIIENLTKTKKLTEEHLKKLEGVDYKVCYLRDIEGKSLQEIADELKYSLSYVEKVSSRNKVE